MVWTAKPPSTMEKLNKQANSMEAAIQQISSVKNSLSRNTYDVKCHIQNTVSRQLEALRNREVWLLNQVDLLQNVKEDVLCNQQSHLTKALGAVQRSIELISVDGQQDDEGMHMDLDSENLSLRPEENPYISFNADSVGLRELIVNYGNIESKGMPLRAAFADRHARLRSECLPSSFEDYDDEEHHILYKTVEEVNQQSHRCPGHEVTGCMPRSKLSQWLLSPTSSPMTLSPTASSCYSHKPLNTPPASPRTLAQNAISIPVVSLKLTDWLLSNNKERPDVEQVTSPLSPPSKRSLSYNGGENESTMRLPPGGVISPPRGGAVSYPGDSVEVSVESADGISLGEEDIPERPALVRESSIRRWLRSLKNKTDMEEEVADSGFELVQRIASPELSHSYSCASDMEICSISSPPPSSPSPFLSSPPWKSFGAELQPPNTFIAPPTSSTVSPYSMLPIPPTSVAKRTSDPVDTVNRLFKHYQSARFMDRRTWLSPHTKRLSADVSANTFQFSKMDVSTVDPRMWLHPAALSHNQTTVAATPPLTMVSSTSSTPSSSPAHRANALVPSATSPVHQANKLVNSTPAYTTNHDDNMVIDDIEIFPDVAQWLYKQASGNKAIHEQSRGNEPLYDYKTPTHSWLFDYGYSPPSTAPTTCRFPQILAEFDHISSQVFSLRGTEGNDCDSMDMQVVASAGALELIDGIRNSSIDNWVVAKA